MSRYRQLANSFFGFAIGALFGGLMIIGGEYNEFRALDNREISDALVVTGVLAVPKHAGKSTIITVTEADGTSWECYIGYCGYAGDREDLGKTVRAWVLGGQLVQIEVDGKVRLALEHRVSGHRRGIAFGFSCLALGPILLAVGLHFRRKSKVPTVAPQ